MLCLDLEGVLVPEVWQAVAASTGIDALNKTTRDIPVYDDLMQYRLKIVAEHGISLSDIQAEISKLSPLPGAKDFLAWARDEFQVAIISDTFYEFGMPLMKHLDMPMLLCHKLVVEDDQIVSYQLRQTDPKRASVKAFKSLDYRVFAAGDSYNDVSMLDEADAGFFFCAPDNVIADYPDFVATEGYEDLKAALLAARNS